MSENKKIEKSDLRKKFAAVKKPLVIVGQSLYDAGCFKELAWLVENLTNLIKPNWNGYCFLPLHASRIGALSIGWSSKTRNKPGKVTWLLGADEIRPDELAPDAFVIYQGHHGDRGAQLADIVLPSSAYTEKEATWMNCEGRMQRSRTAVPPPGEARHDWAIIRALAEVLGANISYEDLNSLQQELDQFGHLDQIPQVSSDSNLLETLRYLSDQILPVHPNTPLKSPISDYYLSDCISRASPTMASCSQQFVR